MKWIQTVLGIVNRVQRVGCKGDDAGHIRAKALGGRGGKGSKNIFPQSPKVNRGKYRVFEQKLKKWVIACHTTKPAELIESFVCNDKYRRWRPTKVLYTVKAMDPDNDCKWTSFSWGFANPRTAQCDE
jgi:hypothetical protein